MSDELRIECKPLGRETGDAMERSFYAEIGLAVGEEWLTLLEDLGAHTVRTHLRGSVHRLAIWFAANWWRLRWEPETRDSRRDVDWRIAHSMASAGGGYVWPNLIFASDGDSVAVASLPRLKTSTLEPIRYLNRILTRVTAAEFETKVDAFLEGVLSRMHSLSIDEDSLPELWKTVLDERRDSEAAQWRKLEALCGYDPDEAPEALIKALIQDQAGLGNGALEEMAAEGRHSTKELLKPILDLAASRRRPAGGGFHGKMPELSAKPRYEPHMRTWQQASKLAQIARKEWGLGQKPISNKQFADFLETKPAVFSDRTKGPISLPIALQSGTSGSFDFYFDSAWATSRRFAAARLLGDHLHEATDGRLIPATHAKTSRQQFQRAFAQEFLCPFKALVGKIQTDHPDDEEITNAADYFGVSPQMVRTTLVNKGELDREALGWAA